MSTTTAKPTVETIILHLHSGLEYTFDPRERIRGGFGGSYLAADVPRLVREGLVQWIVFETEFDDKRALDAEEDGEDWKVGSEFETGRPGRSSIRVSEIVSVDEVFAADR